MYSFDIFDTLITRCTAEPKGIFMLMKEKIQESREYPSFFTENFCELRIGAEELVRVHIRDSGKQEVTLNDIYQMLAAVSCLTKRQQEQLMKLEVETEYNCVLGISQNIRKLRELKSRGEHIVLISDMYLSGEQLCRILYKVDAVFRNIPIYVSSDYRKTKGSGELYRIVRKQENADYSDWVHYGDNVTADVNVASRLGIRTVHWPAAGLMEYEEPGENIFQQISAGISRYIRWTGNGNSAGEVGCSLAGPILYLYVKWVISECVRKGINRLYFIARDGWILQQVADIVIKTGNYPIKTTYLYGSRKAWRLPAYEGDIESFKEILRGANLEEVFCLADLAGALQLEFEVLSRFLPKSCNKIKRKERISRHQRDYICGQLAGNQAFRDFFTERQTGKKSLAIRYLQQVVDASDDKFAFVELYGTGLTQKCLVRLMETFYTGEVKNFYFTFKGVQENSKCSFYNFYPNNLERCYMIELLCRAPHGQTESYKEEAGFIQPALEQTEGEKIKGYYLDEYRHAVLTYAEYMENAFCRNRLMCSAVLALVKKYIEVITTMPPQRIAKYFCHMPYSSSGRENGIVEFAPPVSPKQLRQIYFWGDGSNVREVYQGNSLDYALAVSEKSMRYKEKCLKYRQTKVGKWLTGWNRYLHTHLKPGIAYFCPWELLQGSIVIYGAGKVGQAYAEQARQRYARCSSLLWVDQDYERLQAEGLQVTSPEEIRAHTFDRIIIAIHQDAVRQEVWDNLREMGIEAEKIYYG